MVKVTHKTKDYTYGLPYHMRLVVMALVVVIVMSSLTMFSLAAGKDEDKYNLNAISKAAASIWAFDKSGGEDGGEDTASEAGKIRSATGSSGLYGAANFLGFSSNHRLADSNTDNSTTINYNALKPYSGAYGYAMYGHMLYMAGFDTTVQTSINGEDASASASARRLQGGLLLISYFANKSYSSMMDLALTTLQKLNIFRYLYVYASNITVQDNTATMDGSYTYSYTDYNGHAHTVTVAKDKTTDIDDKTGEVTTSAGHGSDVYAKAEDPNSPTGENGYVVVNGQKTRIGSSPVTFKSGEAQKSPGVFRKAMKFVARLYSVLFNLGWTIVLPMLFVMLGVAFLLYTRHANRGMPNNTLWPHIKKIIVYILWLTLIIPGIATLYTAALDDMVSQTKATNNTMLADNIVLSTLFDFERFAIDDQLSVAPDGMGTSSYKGMNPNLAIMSYDGPTNGTVAFDNKADKAIWYNAESKQYQLSPQTYFGIRNTAFMLNVRYYDSSNLHNTIGSWSVFGTDLKDYVGDVSEDNYQNDKVVFGGDFNADTDPMMGALLGYDTNTNRGSKTLFVKDQNSALQLILRFMTNETINASTVASEQQGIFNTTHKEKESEMQQYWEAAVNPDTYKALAEGDTFGLRNTSSGYYGIGNAGGAIPYAADFFTTYNGKDVQNKGFSALGMYNFLSTDFSNGSHMVIYDNSEGKNVTTNVNHYAVSCVGTGAMRWLYVLDAVAFMLCCAVIGLFYCCSMFLSVMKHSIQALLSLIKGILSDMTAMVKSVVLAFWMCIEIILTVGLYKILTEALVGIASLIQRGFMQLLVGNDNIFGVVFGKSDVAKATGGLIFNALVVIGQLIAFIAIMVLAIKFRKMIVKSLTEFFEAIIDRICGVRTSVSQQGTPVADAAKRGLGNVLTASLIGAQNSTLGRAAGNIAGVAGGAVKTVGAGAGIFGLAKWFTGSGAAQQATEAAAKAAEGANEAMNNATEALTNGAGAATDNSVANNSTTEFNDTDATSQNSEGTSYQSNDQTAMDYGKKVDESIENGTFSSNKTLEQNADSWNNTVNNQESNQTTTDGSSNSNNTYSKNGDKPQKGSAGSDKGASVKNDTYVNNNSNSQTHQSQSHSAKNNTNVNENARNNVVQQNQQVNNQNAANGRGGNAGGTVVAGKTLDTAVKSQNKGSGNVATNGGYKVATGTQIKNGANGGMAAGAKSTSNPVKSQSLKNTSTPNATNRNVASASRPNSQKGATTKAPTSHSRTSTMPNGTKSPAMAMANNNMRTKAMPKTNNPTTTRVPGQTPYNVPVNNGRTMATPNTRTMATPNMARPVNNPAVNNDVAYKSAPTRPSTVPTPPPAMNEDAMRISARPAYTPTTYTAKNNDRDLKKPGSRRG